MCRHPYLERDPHALCIAQEQLKARDAVDKAKQRAREVRTLRRQEEESAKNRLDKINSYMEEKVSAVRPFFLGAEGVCTNIAVTTSSERPEEIHLAVGIVKKYWCVGVDHA